MNYYSFHIGDYHTATEHLTPMEDLIYRRLIDRYYEQEGPIQLETQSVSRRLRLGSDEGVLHDLQNVLDEFFVKHEDGYHHERCDSEIKKYRRMSANARSNGRKGGRKASEKSKVYKSLNPPLRPGLTDGIPVVYSSHPTAVAGVESGRSGGVANQEPIPNNQYPTTNNQEKIQEPPKPPEGGRTGDTEFPSPHDGMEADGNLPEPPTWLEEIPPYDQTQRLSEPVPDAALPPAVEAPPGEPAPDHSGMGESVSGPDAGAGESAKPRKPAKRRKRGEPTADQLAGFEAFWTVWPKRVARLDAERAWSNLAPDATMQAAILAAVEAQKATHDWIKSDGQYIPHPATWLNARRWVDETRVAIGKPYLGIDGKEITPPGGAEAFRVRVRGKHDEGHGFSKDGFPVIVTERGPYKRMASGALIVYGGDRFDAMGKFVPRG